MNVNFGQANTQNKNKKSQILRTTGALAAGVVAPQIVQPIVTIGACEAMSKMSSRLNEFEVPFINKQINKVVNELTNLGSKGVKIVDGRKLDPFDLRSFQFSGSSVFAKFKNYILDFIDPVRGIVNGKNAGFCSGNIVAYHPEKMSLAAFHELGHAHNYNNSKFWKFIQTHCRKPAMLIPFAIATFVAFTKNSKPEEGKDLNFAQKTKNFIRKHAEKIAVATTLPMIAEEIAASVKGCKWANKLLDKRLAKKVLSTNILGAITYLSIPLCFALGIHFAKKIKDKPVA